MQATQLTYVPVALCQLRAHSEYYKASRLDGDKINSSVMSLQPTRFQPQKNTEITHNSQLTYIESIHYTYVMLDWTVKLSHGYILNVQPLITKFYNIVGLESDITK